MTMRREVRAGIDADILPLYLEHRVPVESDALILDVVHTPFAAER